MQFLRQSLNDEAKKSIAQWFLMPQRESVIRCVKARISEFQVKALDYGTKAEGTPMEAFTRPGLEIEAKRDLMEAARLQVFLEVLEEMRTTEPYTGTIQP